MATSTFIRWSGLAAILAGLTSTVLGADSTPGWLYLVSSLLTIIALVGIYLYLRERAGIWALLGFVLGLVGNLLFVFDFPFEIGSGIYALGLILLGVGALRAKQFPAWVPWAWILAPVIGIPGLFLSSLADALFMLGGFAFAAGTIGAGWHLWRKAELGASQVGHG